MRHMTVTRCFLLRLLLLLCAVWLIVFSRSICICGSNDNGMSERRRGDQIVGN